MTTLVKTELQCPFCERQFVTQAVQATNAFGGKRTDFHERAAGGQPYPYQVHTCSSCGFTAAEHTFRSQPPEIDSSPLFRGELREFCADGARKIHSGSDKWDLAAKIEERFFGHPKVTADLYLRAAWCAVDEGDTEAERYYRIHAAQNFAIALADRFGGHVAEADRALFTYLTGELWRRAGFVARAVEWFDRVPDEVVDKVTPNWVLDIAKQQRDCPREWFG